MEATLKQTYLTNGLSDEEVAMIAALAKEKNFVAGEIIIHRGDPPNALYVVLQGRVELVTDDLDKLGDVGPGNLLGEASLLSRFPSDFDAVCSGLTKVAEIHIDELRHLLNQHRNMGFMVLANIGSLLCQRLHAASIVMHHLHEHDAWEGSY